MLPSTLGLVAPEDPANSIRIEVGVRSGGKDGPVRVVREVVTTIPADRVAMLNLPIQFLWARRTTSRSSQHPGDLKSSDCPEGKTCNAACRQTKRGRFGDPARLRRRLGVHKSNSDPSKGQCFDVAKCFESAELIDVTTLDTGAWCARSRAGIDAAN